MANTPNHVNMYYWMDNVVLIDQSDTYLSVRDTTGNDICFYCKTKKDCEKLFNVLCKICIHPDIIIKPYS